MTFGPFFKFGFVLSVLTMIADYASKWMIINVVMDPPRIIPMTPFFNLVLGWNRGVSFGFLNMGTNGQWILIALTSTIVVCLFIWLNKIDRKNEAIAIGLIIGGATGNIIDRIKFGGVTDFLDFYYGAYHWPAFNGADTFIFLGAAIMILDSLYHSPEKS